MRGKKTDASLLHAILYTYNKSMICAFWGQVELLDNPTPKYTIKKRVKV